MSCFYAYVGCGASGVSVVTQTRPWVGRGQDLPLLVDLREGVPP